MPNDSASQSWDAGHGAWQAIGNARPIPAADAQRKLAPPAPVTAWIVWERDGLELIDTIATHYAARDVLVGIQDPRLRTQGVWLTVQDARLR